jgi:hypothetical protein
MQILWAFHYNPLRSGSSKPSHEIAVRQFRGSNPTVAILPGQNCVVCPQAQRVAIPQPAAAAPAAGQNREAILPCRFLLLI